MKKIILSFAAIIMGGLTMLAPAVLGANVFADSSSKCPDGVETSILGNGGCSNGDIQEDILNPIVTIMSVLVWALGIVGVVVVGIQYLTAGGNEEQTRKAKRRLLEIIIGLILYTVGFFVLQWLGITTNQIN